MKKRELGRTGIAIAPVVFGGNVFGWTADKKTSFALLDRFVEAGYNAIDTADSYSRWVAGNSGGESETIIGEWQKSRGNRDKVVIVTKVGSDMGQGKRDLSAKWIAEEVDASLTRLQTDWIDLYQVHRSQSDIPIDETLRALDDLIRQGKVRYIGTSMFPAWKSVEALWASKELKLNRFVSEQMAYNLLDRTAEREVIPAAQTFGLALIPWAPLCGGLLTGKYKRDDQSAAGRWHGGKDNFGRPATPAAYDVIEGVVALAKEKGCTPSQLALAWNASQPGITAPIIGPRTLEQLLDNVGASGVTITDADRARLDALAPPWSSTMRYYEAAMAIDFRPNLARW